SAWFIRGANDRGVNRIRDWLDGGYISIGWEDSRYLRPEMTVAELGDAIRRAVPEISRGLERMGAGNMDRFFHRMQPGDLVLTVDRDGSAYLGRLGELLDKHGESEEKGAVWRRAVTWVNAAEPLSRARLP